MSHTYPRKPPSPERSSRSQKELRDRYWNTILSNPPGFQPNSDSHGGRISSKQGGSAGHGSTSASMSSNPKGSSSHSESTTGRGKSSRSTPPKPFRCSACPRSFERQGHLDVSNQSEKWKPETKFFNSQLVYTNIFDTLFLVHSLMLLQYTN